jgi:hypothetical protein
MRRSRHCRAALAAGTIGLAAAPVAAEGDAGRVEAALAAVMDAYGGRDRLLAAEGYRVEGRVLSLADGVNGTLDLELALDGSMRAELRYPGRTEVRILAGALAWHGGSRRQRPAEPDMADSMRLQYHRLAAPFELAESSAADLADEGDSPEGWIRLRREWGERTSTLYEIDPGTGMIQRVRGMLGEGEDAIEFVADSADFRDIEGVLFPFRITTYVGDHVAAETILDRVEPEDRFPPGTFLPAGTRGDL